MEIIDSLRFIAGAIARKDFVPELCHIKIENNTVRAYDGLLSMSSPIEIGITAKPHAQTFIQAIKACDDPSAVTFGVTKAGRVSIKQGKFKAFIKALEDDENMETMPMPEGVEVPVTETLFDSIETLAPFMGIDASRPWAMGIRLCGNSSYVTNNIILMERWHGAQFPFEIIIPAEAVKQLLIVKQYPVKMMVSHNSATFFYDDGRWIRTQLVSGEWPEQAVSILEMPGELREFPDEFFLGLSTLKKFAEEGTVNILDGRLATHMEDGVGAAYEIDLHLEAEPRFQISQLAAIEPVATKIDLEAYPKPCPFRGELLRGVILGMQRSTNTGE